VNERTCIYLCRTIAYCLFALTILVPRLGLAQPTTEEWAFGYEAFNLLLQESDIKICGFREWNKIPDDEKFAIHINHNTNYQRSPAMTGVPALVMNANGRGLKVQFRPTLGLVKGEPSVDYYSSPDCPIVRPDSTHEVFLGVQAIVCNTPGYISRKSRQASYVDEQFYPSTVMPNRRGLGPDEVYTRAFSILTEEPDRRIWVADPVLFTNQMVFKADNLRFADNTIGWLSDDYRRKNVLLLIAGRPQPAVDPNDLDILTPIPTHDEVFELLEQMRKKPQGIAGFANSFVQKGEDENLLNEMAHKYTDDLKDGEVSRIILFAIFTCCCAVGLATYFWQRRILRKTASATTSRRKRNFANRNTDTGASERQAAASMLLNSFCLDTANRRLADWPEFPTPIISGSVKNESHAVRATNEMADAYWRLRTKPKKYWTKQMLIELERDTNIWRQLILHGDITMPTEKT